MCKTHKKEKTGASDKDYDKRRRKRKLNESNYYLLVSSEYRNCESDTTSEESTDERCSIPYQPLDRGNHNEKFIDRSTKRKTRVRSDLEEKNISNNKYFKKVKRFMKKNFKGKLTNDSDTSSISSNESRQPKSSGPKKAQLNKTWNKNVKKTTGKKGPKKKKSGGKGKASDAETSSLSSTKSGKSDGSGPKADKQQQDGIIAKQTKAKKKGKKKKISFVQDQDADTSSLGSGKPGIPGPGAVGKTKPKKGEENQKKETQEESGDNQDTKSLDSDKPEEKGAKKKKKPGKKKKGKGVGKEAKPTVHGDLTTASETDEAGSVKSGGSGSVEGKPTKAAKNGPKGKKAAAGKKGGRKKSAAPGAKEKKQGGIDKLSEDGSEAKDKHAEEDTESMKSDNSGKKTKPGKKPKQKAKKADKKKKRKGSKESEAEDEKGSVKSDGDENKDKTGDKPIKLGVMGEKVPDGKKKPPSGAKKTKGQDHAKVREGPDANKKESVGKGRKEGAAADQDEVYMDANEAKLVQLLTGPYKSYFEDKHDGLDRHDCAYSYCRRRCPKGFRMYAETVQLHIPPPTIWARWALAQRRDLGDPTWCTDMVWKRIGPSLLDLKRDQLTE